MNLDKFFEKIYFESLFNRILEDEENNSIFKNQTDKSNLSGNWKDEMKQLKTLLTQTINLNPKPFSEENVNKIGEFNTTPIENVFMDKIGDETQYQKIGRKKGGRGEIDRRKYLDAIPKVLSNHAFIIKHIPTEEDDYKTIRHFYFGKTNLQGESVILMFVVDLENPKRPKLLSFQNIDDIYKKIKEGNFILCKGRQKTEVQLQKTVSNP